MFFLEIIFLKKKNCARCLKLIEPHQYTAHAFSSYVNVAKTSTPHLMFHVSAWKDCTGNCFAVTLDPVICTTNAICIRICMCVWHERVLKFLCKQVPSTEPCLSNKELPYEVGIVPIPTVWEPLTDCKISQRLIHLLGSRIGINFSTISLIFLSRIIEIIIVINYFQLSNF